MQLFKIGHEQLLWTLKAIMTNHLKQRCQESWHPDPTVFTNRDCLYFAPLGNMVFVSTAYWDPLTQVCCTLPFYVKHYDFQLVKWFKRSLSKTGLSEGSNIHRLTQIPWTFSVAYGIGLMILKSNHLNKLKKNMLSTCSTYSWQKSYKLSGIIYLYMELKKKGPHPQNHIIYRDNRYATLTFERNVPNRTNFFFFLLEVAPAQRWQAGNRGTELMRAAGIFPVMMPVCVSRLQSWPRTALFLPPTRQVLTEGWGRQCQMPCRSPVRWYELQFLCPPVPWLCLL